MRNSRTSLKQEIADIRQAVRRNCAHAHVARRGIDRTGVPAWSAERSRIVAAFGGLGQPFAAQLFQNSSLLNVGRRNVAEQAECRRQHCSWWSGLTLIAVRVARMLNLVRSRSSSLAIWPRSWPNAAPATASPLPLRRPDRGRTGCVRRRNAPLQCQRYLIGAITLGQQHQLQPLRQLLARNRQPRYWPDWNRTARPASVPVCRRTPAPCAAARCAPVSLRCGWLSGNELAEGAVARQQVIQRRALQIGRLQLFHLVAFEKEQAPVAAGDGIR